jgi:nucleotide-binding universal stress UspA family protein
MGEQAFEIGTDGPRVIVVGVDGSTSSFRAAAYAAGIARREHARLVGVYVYQGSPTTAGVAGVDGSAWYRAVEAKEQLKDEICSQLASDHVVWGPRFDVVVRVGNPTTEILAVAKETGADEIVVGGSAAIRHRLTGSLASRLLRRRNCVVTVVP